MENDRPIYYLNYQDDDCDGDRFSSILIEFFRNLAPTSLTRNSQTANSINNK